MAERNLHEMDALCPAGDALEMLKKLVRDISYNNAKNYFGL